VYSGQVVACSPADQRVSGSNIVSTRISLPYYTFEQRSFSFNMPWMDGLICITSGWELLDSVRLNFISQSSTSSWQHFNIFQFCGDSESLVTLRIEIQPLWLLATWQRLQLQNHTKSLHIYIVNFSHFTQHRNEMQHVECCLSRIYSLFVIGRLFGHRYLHSIKQTSRNNLYKNFTK